MFYKFKYNLALRITSIVAAIGAISSILDIVINYDNNLLSDQIFFFICIAIVLAAILVNFNKFVIMKDRLLIIDRTALIIALQYRYEDTEDNKYQRKWTHIWLEGYCLLGYCEWSLESFFYDN